MIFRCKWICLIVLICPFSLWLSAQEPDTTLRDALQELRTDIARDTEALNDLRAQIETERAPLAQRLESLRDTVAARRKELDRVRQFQSQGQAEQARILARTEAMQEEYQYLRALLTEYARDMTTRMNIAQNPEIMAEFKWIPYQLERDPVLFAPLTDLFNLSFRWNRDRIGGMSFVGAALDDKGIEHAGTFATFGPIGYFAAEAPDGPVGMSILRFGSDQPAVYHAFPPETLAAIRTVATGGEAVVPVDVSDGDAIRVAEATPGLLAQLRQGGTTMIPLALVAAAALFLALWKSIELSRIRLRADTDIDAVLQALRQGDVDAARVSAQPIQRPLRRLVDDLIEYRDASREHLEEIMHEHILAALPFLERNLGALAVLGGVAPLLGLLGTVTGMIHTFRLVTLFGSGDAKLLAGGISEALVTTLAGLAIAIPTLLVHAALARRARSIIGSLESQAASLVNDLKLRSAP